MSTDKRWKNINTNGRSIFIMPELEVGKMSVITTALKNASRVLNPKLLPRLSFSPV